MNNIQHPSKNVVKIAVGLSWGNDAIFQEKLDGKFAVRAVGDGILAGENVRGNFIVWDCLQYAGEDVRAKGFADRWRLAFDLCGHWHLPMVETSHNGGELLQRVLARGGEGVVKKLPHATYWDAMDAAKRLQTWICRVVAFCGGSQSVEIADASSGQARGKLALRGGKCDRVRIGSLVKVEGFSLLPSGMIRESRVCSDTPTSWLVTL